jgi:hypothetical protein
LLALRASPAPHFGHRKVHRFSGKPRPEIVEQSQVGDGFGGTFGCDADQLSTPLKKCIGSPEQKYISDAGKKAPELGAFS